jgi:hypothetical protein
MSDERAAAHIIGVYQVLAAIVLVVGGVVGGWITRGAVEEAKLEAAKKRPEVARGLAGEFKPQAKKVGDQQGGLNAARVIEDARVIPAIAQESVVHLPEPKPAMAKSAPKKEPAPEPSNISFLEYSALNSGDALTPIEREKSLNSLVGKTITWVGYFDDLSLSEDYKAHYYRLVMYSGLDLNATWGAVNVYFPESVGFPESWIITTLSKGDGVRFSGEMLSRGNIEGATIERVYSSPISMADYHDKLKANIPLTTLTKEYLGKLVDWNGYVHSWDIYPETPGQQYRLSLVPGKENFHEYFYCYLSKEAAPCLDCISDGTPVHITGVLTGRSNVKLTGIALRKE